MTARASPEYISWCSMRYRCNNPQHHKYKDYGARGIRVCDRWQSFANFLADMGPRPGPGFSIDRRDNDRGYEPENCRWATATTQNGNRHYGARITVDGESLCLAETCRRLGLNYSRTHRRLRRKGWDIFSALMTP